MARTRLNLGDVPTSTENAAGQSGGLRGQLPRTPGQVVLKEGQDVRLVEQLPDGLTQAQIDKVLAAQEAQALELLKQKATQNPFQAPRERDMTQLSAEEKVAITESLKTFQQVMTGKPVPAATPLPAAPKAAPAAAAAEVDIPADISFQPSDPSVLGAMRDIVTNKEEAPEVDVEAELLKAANAGTPGAGGGGKGPAGECPCCRWPLDLPYEAEITSEDFDRCTELWLGGQPYSKTIKLFRNKLGVVFKTPTVKLSRLAMLQTVLDSKEGKLSGINDFLAALEAYHLCLGLDLISIEDGVEIDVGGPILEAIERQGSTLEKTPLPGILESLAGTPPLNQEPVWNAVMNAFRQFRRHSDRVTALAGNPNF